VRTGITLLTVPCWWDMKLDRYGRSRVLSFLLLLLLTLFRNSLVALIKFLRPDLLVDRPTGNIHKLTPLNPKENYWPRTLLFLQ
jgi:hypothetical protein